MYIILSCFIHREIMRQEVKRSFFSNLWGAIDWMGYNWMRLDTIINWLIWRYYCSSWKFEAWLTASMKIWIKPIWWINRELICIIYYHFLNLSHRPIEKKAKHDNKRENRKRERDYYMSCNQPIHFQLLQMDFRSQTLPHPKTELILNHHLHLPECPTATNYTRSSTTSIMVMHIQRLAMAKPGHPRLTTTPHHTARNSYIHQLLAVVPTKPTHQRSRQHKKQTNKRKTTQDH